MKTIISRTLSWTLVAISVLAAIAIAIPMPNGTPVMHHLCYIILCLTVIIASLVTLSCTRLRNF